MKDLTLPTPCEGSKFHSPTPLITTTYDLVGFGGTDLPSDPRDPVTLCGVCSDNLQVFLDLMEDGIPWETQRRFGNQIRGLAKRVRAHRGEN